ncbi:hypothetical protein MHU86_22123 [Fragilaria crotonensis]|nr:hypothetical protein MHU86_22123 [Fragilaria crotonensis]
MSHLVIRVRFSRKNPIDVEKSVPGNITRVPVRLLLSSADVTIMLMENVKQAGGNRFGGVETCGHGNLRCVERETHLVNTDTAVGIRIGAVARVSLAMVARARRITTGVFAAVVIRARRITTGVFAAVVILVRGMVNGSAHVRAFGVMLKVTVCSVRWVEKVVRLIGSLVNTVDTGSIVEEETSLTLVVIVGLALPNASHTGKRVMGATRGTGDATDWGYPVEIDGMVCRRVRG